MRTLTTLSSGNRASAPRDAAVAGCDTDAGLPVYDTTYAYDATVTKYLYDIWALLFTIPPFWETSVASLFTSIFAYDVSKSSAALALPTQEQTSFRWFAYVYIVSGNTSNYAANSDLSLTANGYASYECTTSMPDAAITFTYPPSPSEYNYDKPGLYYYGQRYYQPEVGRWLSRDPMEEQGGYNVYAFVLNSPPHHSDSLGLTADTPKHICCKQEDVDKVAAEKVKHYAPQAGKNGREYCGLICCDKKGVTYATSDHPGFNIRTQYKNGVIGIVTVCDAFRIRDDIDLKEGENVPDSGPEQLTCGKDVFVGKWHVHPSAGDGEPSPGDKANRRPPQCPTCGNGCYVGASGTKVCPY